MLKEVYSSLPEREKNYLKNWSDSVFSLYTVINIRKGVGYSIEDMFLEHGKRKLIADTTSSILMRKYDLMFVRAYDFEIYSRFGSGVIKVPYSTKEELMDILHSGYKTFQNQHAISTDNPENRKKFLRETSLEIIHKIEQVAKTSREKKFITPEGHEIMFCSGTVKIRETGTAINAISKSKDFIVAAGNKKHFYNWIDPDPPIPHNPEVKDKKNVFILQTQLVDQRGNGLDTDSGLIVYGNLEFKKNDILISATSRERYDFLKASIKRILGSNLTGIEDEKFTKMSDEFRTNAEEENDSEYDYIREAKEGIQDEGKSI